MKMGRMLHGFDDGDAVLTGVESRSSSPVRIMRKQIHLKVYLLKDCIRAVKVQAMQAELSPPQLMALNVPKKL